MVIMKRISFYAVQGSEIGDFNEYLTLFYLLLFKGDFKFIIYLKP